ncbi:MAG: hypothetical protein ACP5QG_06045 [candidate division WOR-3 bacterium]
MTVVKGLKMRSAIMIPGFLSDWFEGGIGNAGAFLEDGTPLYLGMKKRGEVYIGFSEELFGPYEETGGPFVVSPDGNCWTKLVKKPKGWLLLRNGEGVGSPHDYIWPVFFDSSSNLYYRFTDGIPVGWSGTTNCCSSISG